MLFGRFQAGDDGAYAQLLLRYQRSVFNFIRRMVGGGPDCEDLAQEAFVRVYEQAASLARPDRFRSWLWAIAANLCRDYAKSQRYRRHASLELMSGTSLEPMARGRTDQRLEAHELTRVVEEALAALPADRRAMVLLREYEGLAYEEIAAALHCPLAQVRWKLHAARRELRRRLAPLLEGRQA